jgi:hypothetical protein
MTARKCAMEKCAMEKCEMEKKAENADDPGNGFYPTCVGWSHYHEFDAPGCCAP